jgi:hypothetical protein
MELDAESRSAVKIYLDYIKKGPHVGWPMHVEQRLVNRSLRKADPTDPGVAPVFGTADCILEQPKLGLLTVIDYKHGKGVVVEAVDNYQLALYGLMALDNYLGHKHLKLVIVQPRAEHPDGPIRQWSISAAELDRIWFPRFQQAINHVRLAQQNPEQYLQAGDHCRWCRAAATECPEIKQQSLAKAQAAFDDGRITVPDPAALDTAELARVLDAEPLLMTYLKACKARAAQLLGQGEQVPGRKMVRSYTNRRWSNERTVEARLRELGLMDLEMFNRKLKSPNQIKKSLATDEYERILEYVTRDEKKPVMALESDNRKAIDGKDAIIRKFEE